MHIRYKFLLFLLVTMSCFPLFSQDTVETLVRETSSDDNSAIMNIRTNVSGVEVYLNNLYKGISPLTLENIVPATYVVTLKKDGWETKSVFVQFEEKTETNLYFELLPITGFISIHSNVFGAEVYLDGTLVDMHNSLDTGLIEVQEGLHTIEIRKFGYKTQSKNVNVFEKYLSEVSFDMEKALFEVSSFLSKPKKFNPLAPGGLGIAQFSFTVTAPGSAVFNVFDKNGVIVYSEYFPNFMTPYHSAKWNGRNSLGIALGEGQYRVELEATASEGWETGILSAEQPIQTVKVNTFATIDNSIYYPLVNAGVSGSTVGLPSARLMPQGTTVISFAGLTDFSLSSGFSAFPFSLGAMFTPFSFLELSFRLGAEAGPQASSTLPIFVGGALKASKNLHNMFLTGIVRYTYASDPIHSFSNIEPGLGIGAVFGIEVDDFFFSLSEEFVIGNNVGIIYSFDGYVKSALGMQYQSGSISTNIWASLYSPFDYSAFSLVGMVETGVDVSVLLAQTTLAPMVGCSYVYSGNQKHSIAARFGLNIIVP